MSRRPWHMAPLPHTHASRAVFMAALWLGVVVVNASSQAVVEQRPSAVEIAQGERFELSFTLDRTYDNPYDADRIVVDITITEPDGGTRLVPAFFSMDFDVAPGDPERYVNGRNSCWKARFTPMTLGDYRYDISVRDADGTRTVPGVATFRCVPGDAKGFIRIDPRDPALLRHETGEPYIPIGHNVGWAPNATGLAWWERHFDACAAAGLTWTRIWMCQFQGGQNLEWSSARGPYWRGAGWLAPEIAFKLDRIVEMAEARGLAIQLVLQHHGQVSTRVNPNWNEHPYNGANAEIDGGWLDAPEDFFTDAEARRLTRNRYRYIVARWGYSRAIHSWELWNEVQWADGWTQNREAVVAWHREMAQYLRAQDPFDHLITTSSDFMLFSDVWQLPEIELVQVHTYTEAILPSFAKSMERLQRFGKPVILAEYGLQAEGRIPEFHPEDQPEPKRTQIVEGLHLHNGIWAAFHMKSGGHLWWWDHYIEARNLFAMYTPLARYAAGEDLGAAVMKPATVSLAVPQGDAAEGTLAAVALAGESRALLWIYDTGSQYGAQHRGPIEGATAALPMPDGVYTLEYWATRGHGGTIVVQEATATKGTLHLKLPTFDRDIAVKIIAD